MAKSWSRRDEHTLKLVRKRIHGRCPQFLTRTFVLVQPARVISCICLLEEQIGSGQEILLLPWKYGF